MDYSEQQKKAYNELKKRLVGYMSSVQSIYDNISAQAADIALKTEYDPESNEVFSFSDYPEQRTAIQKMQNDFVTDLSNLIDRGVTKEWQMSNEAQNLLVNSMVESAGVRLNNFYQKKFWQYNDDALNAFKKRKDKGMSIQTKIWQHSSELKTQLEDTISVAIQRGMSAVTLSKRISQYLQNYPKLKQDYGEKFGNAIRCRDCEYKSIRLARTEINMSYRMAEQERWRNLDFVLGYRIKLSKNHTCNGMPFVDICDDLAGDYPKDFIWAGWHPSCRCYAIPILMSEAEFEKLNLGEPTTEKPLTEMPKQFNEWLATNADRIENAQERGTLPYFLKDNKQVLISINNNYAHTNCLSIKLEPTTIRDISQVKEVISEFAKDHPECFARGFKDIVAVSREVGYMSTDCNGVISINFAKDNNGFNAGESIISAISKLKSKQKLTELEEYSVEILWHEILHNKSKNTTILPAITSPDGFPRIVAETINQLTARHTYNDFLKYFNAKPLHYEWVLDNGFGYNATIINLRKILEKASIDEKSFIKKASDILMQDYKNIDIKISELLQKMYKNKGDISYVFKFLELDFTNFEHYLKILN